MQSVDRYEARSTGAAGRWQVWDRFTRYGGVRLRQHAGACRARVCAMALGDLPRPISGSLKSTPPLCRAYRMAGTGSSGACRCLSQGNFGFEILDHPLQRAALVVRRDAVVLCQEIGQRLLPGAPLLQRSFDEIVHLLLRVGSHRTTAVPMLLGGCRL